MGSDPAKGFRAERRPARPRLPLPGELAAVVDRDGDARRVPVELDDARVLEDAVLPDTADAPRRLDAPAHARRPVAKALVRGVLEGEAAAQAAAQPGQPPRRHRELLVLRHPKRDRLLVRRVAARALRPAAEAVVSAEARALARADEVQLDTTAEPLRELRLQAREVRALVGLIGQDEARAVEDELGRDRLQRQAVAAQELAEEGERAARLIFVLGDRLAVDIRCAADDLAERRRRR